MGALVATIEEEEFVSCGEGCGVFFIDGAAVCLTVGALLDQLLVWWLDGGNVSRTDVVATRGVGKKA